MSYCVDGRCYASLSLWAAAKVNVGDLSLQDSEHPNVLPFTGTLLILDEPSDQPPHGSDGHQIEVPKAVAARRLNTLAGMAINYQSDLTGHNPAKKVGVITEAWIEGNKVQVKGLVWKKDFPEAARLFKMNKGRLGMSMELGDVYVKEKEARVWVLDDFYFTGATVLYKDHAAYESTDLAASRHFVKALAAASAARGIFHKGGKQEMAEKDTKKEKGQDANKLVAAISAAVEKGVGTALKSFTESQEKTNEATRKVLETISASQEEISKGLHELAVGDVKASSDEDIDLDADVIDIEADATDATMMSDASNVAADASDASDASDVDAGSEDPTNFTSEDQGDDAEPGDLNKDASSLAKSKSRSGSTQMKPGGKAISKGIAAGRVSRMERGEKISSISAARTIRTLQAEKLELGRENSKLRKTVNTMQASIDRYTQSIERKSISPEIHALLEKSNYNVGELMASKTRLSSVEVDSMFEKSGVVLDPTMRMAFKNQLLAAGLMDQGQIVRH